MKSRIRHFFVKQNLLHDLELQLLKAEAIREYMYTKRADNQNEIEQQGYETLEELGKKYGEIKAEMKTILAPYQNGKTIPDSVRAEVTPLEEKRKVFERIIDEHADFEKNIQEKDSLIGETIFYIQKIKTDGSDWLFSANEGLHIGYGRKEE